LLSKKSIRHSFVLQLVLASTVLIVIFSTILYNYIKISIYKDLTNDLRQEATIVAISKSSDFGKIGLDQFNPKSNLLGRKIKMVSIKNKKFKISFKYSSLHGENFLTIFYPFKKKKKLFITIKKDITSTDKLLNEILTNVLTINLIAIFFIIFYALFLSRMLLLPIKSFAMKLANMNESFLQTLDPKSLPEEFVPLGKSINKLVKRIQTFTEYQKELFIGTSHELKTPLAVMKTKNEVTLLKPRKNEKYIQIIKENNQIIDEMSKMISNILEIGRQESAHFEEPIKIDLIQFLKVKANNFKILALQDEKKFEIDITPKHYDIKTQPTLLIHIIQNFVQNAVKFTPIGKKISIKCFKTKQGYSINIIDEGLGIDEKRDLFAPFKRFGNQSGAGLGLFLAKGAANAIGAQISIKNRKDSKGTIANLFIPANKK